MPAPGSLFTDTELADNGPVPGDVGFIKIIQQTAALSDKSDQCTLGGEIFFRGFQMVGEMIDALSEQSDLTFGRAGIILRLPVFFEELLF